jgi:hypothetical protein
MDEIEKRARAVIRRFDAEANAEAEAIYTQYRIDEWLGK